MDDQEIVALFWARDERALEECRRQYGKYCRSIAMRLVSSSEDTEEIENDVYLKAWQTIPPNKPLTLKRYLGMITRQLALDRCRIISAEKRTGYQNLLSEIEDVVSDKEDDPVMRLVFIDTMNRFLSDLPDRSRKMFVQRYWYAYSIDEIAAAWKTNKRIVEMVLYRTRKRLHNYLKKEGVL